MRKKKGKDPFSLTPSLQKQMVEDFLSYLSDTSWCHSDAMKFKCQYLSESLLSKYNDPSEIGAEERRVSAIKKWHSMELRNSVTNVRLFLDDDVSFAVIGGRSLSSHWIARHARNTILRVLGAEPDVDVLYGTFTSGASTSMKRGAGNVAVKFKVGADVTEPCYARFLSILETCETWKYLRGPLQVNVVRGGSLFTVPKNSEIDRCAVKEPDLNMFCQKGVGNYIRNRLNRVLGIDLNDQTRNQQLARVGSIDGSLATLDLSSASDLISNGLVRQLLPEPWFDLLDDIRSQAVFVDGVWIETNMFSSMGNGFTFELESLLFISIAKAIVAFVRAQGAVSVYGDDIIIPSAAAGLLAKVLYWYGLKVNTKKSYWTGPFRESCGKHWYAGVDVTPFFIREPISSMMRLIHFLNRLRVWATSPFNADLCEPHFYPFWVRWSRKVPSSLYGGKDPERIDALVTHHHPRMKLVNVKRKLSVDPLGAYLHWLRTADGRETLGEPIVTSTVMIESQHVVLRRNAVYGTVKIPWYPDEGDYGNLNTLSGLTTE